MPKFPMEKCSEVMKALSDTTRLNIVQILFEKECCVSDIVDILKTSQPHVSHHLAILRAAGLVDTYRDGNRVIYRLHPDLRATIEADESLDFGCCSIHFNLRR